ncbi:MAG TPA: alpha/beta fold hydrolase [Candidatus Paceibacterota bacterium]|nr:alpha/beta fold hydrolase [Candidatus Paceibacterota bacterium]
MKKRFSLIVSLLFILFPTLSSAGTILYEIPDIFTPHQTSWGKVDADAGIRIAEMYFSSIPGPGTTYGVCAVRAPVIRVGNPTDDVILSIYGPNSSGDPLPETTAKVAEAVIPGSSLPASGSSYIAFPLNHCVDLTNGGPWWLVWSRSDITAPGWYASVRADADVISNTSYWYFDSQTNAWAEDTHREWAFKLEGTDDPKTPVIIIPGIIGTEFYQNNELVWPNVNKMLAGNSQFIYDALKLDANGTPLTDASIGGVVKDVQAPFHDIDTFKNLETFLEADGYVLNKNLFYFPYDWRMNLNQTDDLLQLAIADIREKTGSSKVNIIAHSMGGLLVKDYIQQAGKDLIDKLIFVGTPHLGAPKAADMLLHGDKFGIPWLQKDPIQQLAHNMDSLYELMPSLVYQDEFGGYLTTGTHVLNYNESNAYLELQKGLNGNMFNVNDFFFRKLLELTDFSGVDTYNIAGCKVSTPAMYNIGPMNESDPLLNIGYMSGDGTVPLNSSTYINIPDSHKFYAKDVDHPNLPSFVAPQIVNILDGRSIESGPNFSTSSSFCNFKGKTLTWHSPVMVHAYDENGNRAGPIDGEGIENNIPGSYYDIIDGHTFMFLPTDEGQTYRIEGAGTATGTFDLLIGSNDNGQEDRQVVYQNVPVAMSAPVLLNITDTSSDTTISVDGQTVHATQIIGGSTDTVAPTTTATVTGTRGDNDWYRSDVQIALAASDDDSGVQEAFYAINGGSPQLYSGPITVNTEGTTSVQYYSVDQAGNQEAAKTLNIKIDKTAPEFNVQFDTAKEAFAFTSEAPVSCTSISCIAEDAAGNSSVIKFLKIKIGPISTLSLGSVTYNGVFHDLSDNVFIVNFSRKNNKINQLNETILVRGQEIARIDYDRKTDKSMIYNYKDKKLIKSTANGIKHLRVDTTKGIISITTI